MSSDHGGGIDNNVTCKTSCISGRYDRCITVCSKSGSIGQSTNNRANVDPESVKETTDDNDNLDGDYEGGDHGGIADLAQLDGIDLPISIDHYRGITDNIGAFQKWRK
jgi:hypothetical protein